MTGGNKKLHMWIWVAGSAGVIGIIWLSLVKYDIATTVLSVKSSAKSQSIGDFKDEIKKQLEDAGEILNYNAPVSADGGATSTF